MTTRICGGGSRTTWVDCGRFAVFAQEDVAPKTIRAVNTSDTECVDPNPGISRRRLRLMWALISTHRDRRSTQRPGQLTVCSESLLPGLGPCTRSAHSQTVHQQWWSPVNVLLMWRAAGPAPAAFDHSRIRDRLDVHDSSRRFDGVGFIASSFQDLENPRPRAPHSIFEASSPPLNLETTFPAQEVLAEACQENARVALLEVLCTVATCLERELAVPEAIRSREGSDTSKGSQRHRNPVGINSTSSIWRIVLLTKVPTLRKCHISCEVARSSHSRWGSSFAQNGKRCGRGSPGVEIVWVDPAMLVHRPKGVGSVGRAELVRRFDDFQKGHWEQL